MPTNIIASGYARAADGTYKRVLYRTISPLVYLPTENKNLATKLGEMDTAITDRQTEEQVNELIRLKVDIAGISGNSATATKLQNAITIAISGGATGTATSFDGSRNITIPITALDPSTITGSVPVNKGGTGRTSITPNYMLYGSATDVYSEVKTSAFGRTLLNASSGTAFTGLVAESASSAVKLTTARSIGSASFDGTVSITLADMGAAPITSPALTGTPTTPTAAPGNNTTQIASTAFVQEAIYAKVDITGIAANSGSATKLQTARTISIGGVIQGTATSFDGTANIIIPVTSINPSGLGSAVPVNKGGTAKSSIAANSMLYASAANTYSEVVSSEFGRSLLNATSGTAFTGLVAESASSAAKLTAPVAIGAANFDGSVDISIADMGVAPIASPALTGTPTAPTATAGTNTTQIATTAFVTAALTGNSGSTTKLANARTFATSGAATGTATSFDGTANITIPITALDPSYITGSVAVTKGGLGKTAVAANSMLYASAANTYAEVVTSAFGRGLLNAASGVEVTGLYADIASDAVKLQTARTIATTGDATGSASFDGSANASIALTLANSGVTAGTYTKVTVDAKGRVTGASTPTTLAGYSIGDALNLAGGTLTGFLTLHADPTQALHAVTKQYVDNLALGLDTKLSVKAASTANIPVTTATATTLTLTSALTTLDGVALAVGDRILLKNQTTAAQNGLYTYDSSTTLTRTYDANSSLSVSSGLYTFVESGTTNASSGWLLSTTGTVTVGTTALTFIQFSGAGQIVNGTGLSKTGNTLSITNTGVTAGTYKSVTVNAQGQVTGGTNPTTLAGYGITDAVNASTVNTANGLGVAWGYIPYVRSSGEIEIGKMIDFHNTSADGVDYSNRMTSDTNGLTTNTAFIAPEVKATTKFNLNDKVTLTYNDTDKCLEFSFT